jgi:phage protein D
MDLMSTVSQIVKNTYPTAIFKILVDGVDISPIISPRLISLTITDVRGLEADSLDMEISDHDNMVALPRKNTVIEAWIGWSSTGLVYKGKYTVKEIEHAGAPDVLRVRAQSADLKKAFKQKKERSWDNKTIGQIVETVANDHGLKFFVHASLKERHLAHIDQNESDANLLTRIADEHDAVASVKNGTLLVLPKGKGETVTGTELPTKTIVRSDGDSHRYANTEGAEDITGVTTYYYEVNIAEKQKITVGTSDANTREIRHIHRDKATAQHVAQAEYNRIKRKCATMSYNMAMGDPELLPEMTYIFEGMKSDIDAIIWLGTNVSHNLTGDGGYTSALTMEVQLPDSDDLTQLVDDEGSDENYTGFVAWYKNGKSAVKITAGDQSNPKRLTYLYISKVTATVALKREMARLEASKK